MNLPKFEALNTFPMRSTYYTFSKSNKDLDNAVVNEKEWYFTKLVGLNLPKWNISDMFYRFRKTNSSPAGDIACYYEDSTIGNFPELDNNDYVNPNIVIPRLMQYYMENIIRQTNIGGNAGNINVSEYITELAFWKLLKVMGISDSDLYDSNKIVTFVGDISTISFTEIANNHGWAQIIGEIPSNVPLTIIDSTSWINLQNVDNVINVDSNQDHAIYDSDTGSNFTFDMSSSKKVLDFARIQEIQRDFNTQQEFYVNTLLLFYKDESGIEKLHGIDFINPFEELVGTWEQETLKHYSNVENNFGYSFRFNMKSCTNTTTKEIVYAINDGTFYDVFQKCIGDFDSFLELQKQKGNLI